jgi:hypothetical protein
MSDFTSQPERSARRRGAEYNVYFTLIFLFAIPFALVGWIMDVARERTLNLRGPLARAWLEADQITPLIFSA